VLQTANGEKDASIRLYSGSFRGRNSIGAGRLVARAGWHLRLVFQPRNGWSRDYQGATFWITVAEVAPLFLFYRILAIPCPYSPGFVALSPHGEI
jgi:hypothetical protein